MTDFIDGAGKREGGTGWHGCGTGWHEDGDEERSGVTFSRPLQGFISYNENPTGRFATCCRDTFFLDVDGKKCRDSEYLGEAIDFNRGVFQNSGRYVFSFGLERGCGDSPNLFGVRISCFPGSGYFRFRDIWLLDQILGKIGLDKAIENLIPESSGTVKELACYKLTNNDTFNVVPTWYPCSYASYLYPAAEIELELITEFHENLGTKCIYEKFFELYLCMASKNSNIKEQISFRVLLRATLPPENNKLKFITNELGYYDTYPFRITYDFDQKSEMPIFMIFFPGYSKGIHLTNNTVGALDTYGIGLNLEIFDAGRGFLNNILHLLSNKIDFFENTPQNYEYDILIKKFGKSLICGDNAIKLFGDGEIPTLEELAIPLLFNDAMLFFKDKDYQYAKRSFAGIIVAISLDGNQPFGYVIQDIKETYIDTKYTIDRLRFGDESRREIQKSVTNAGKYLLLSTTEYSFQEALKLYCSKQSVSHIFEINSTYAADLPLPAQTIEAVRGIILVSFIADIALSSIGHKLSDSPISAKNEIAYNHFVEIKSFGNINILENLTHEQTEISSRLGLEIPFAFEPESRDPLANSDLSTLENKKSSRGRPKGSKNKPKPDSDGFAPPRGETAGQRGRPKGSRNKPKPGADGFAPD
ncbi:MAG: hypothetical protein LBQ12_05745 [Deltaproteobacteria bacterium]|jgi:hypothetical protein|nr:hypothetical protein [Deltaproteobacteria bacterium]